MLVNTCDGHFYIGRCKGTPQSRWRAHLKGFRSNNRRLRAAIKEYGPEAFLVITLARVPREELAEAEERLLRQFVGHELCYTLMINLKERIFTPETRALISAANKGKQRTPEMRARMSAAHKGKQHVKGYKLSPETRAKMSAAQKGRKATPETRAKMSAAQKGNQRMKGRKLSPETRAKMSAAQKGKQHMKGHRHSPDTRAKISAKRKAWWAARNATSHTRPQHLRDRPPTDS